MGRGHLAPRPPVSAVRCALSYRFYAVSAHWLFPPRPVRLCATAVSAVRWCGGADGSEYIEPRRRGRNRARLTEPWHTKRQCTTHKTQKNRLNASETNAQILSGIRIRCFLRIAQRSTSFGVGAHNKPRVSPSLPPHRKMWTQKPGRIRPGSCRCCAICSRKSLNNTGYPHGFPLCQGGLESPPPWCTEAG